MLLIRICIEIYLGKPPESDSILFTSNKPFNILGAMFSTRRIEMDFVYRE